MDSISIETQIDFCKRQLSDDEDFLEFYDKGYTGANTNRPQFQKMISLCKEGKISKIITYKLDRISRSLLDFVLLLSLLEESRTELVSCTESFSSKSEMGVLIMKLLIMFAEMERKNIRMRVRDNYYARGEKGFYLGGYPPFGYKKCEIYIDGKKTSGYEIHDEESEIVNEIYHRICQNNESATSVCRYLNSKKIPTKKGCSWTTTSLIRLIKNPFYVRADIKIYEYLLSLGGKITSPIECFSGENGVLCYGEKGQKGRFDTFENQYLTVGRHCGIVTSNLWLNARKILENTSSAVKATASNTYLTGMVFCGVCGKKYTITTSKGYTYFYCRGRKTSACNTIVKSIRSDFLEEICDKIIEKALKELSNKKKIITHSDEEIKIRSVLATEKSKLKIAKEKLKKSNEKEFSSILDVVIELENSIKNGEKKLMETVANKENLCYTELMTLAEIFSRLSVSDKNKVAREIIKKIVISQGEIRFLLK